MGRPSEAARVGDLRRRAALVTAVFGVTWVCSHRVSDELGYGWRFTGSDGAYRIRSATVRSSGGVAHFGAGYILPLFVRSGSLSEGWFVDRRPTTVTDARSEPMWSRAGFEHHHIDLTGALVIMSFGVPYWFLCACAAALLAVSWRRWRRTRRRGNVRAVRVHDLRESRERCPECGTPVPGGGGTDNMLGPAKDGVRQS